MAGILRTRITCAKTARFYRVHVLWVVRAMASVVLVSFVSQTMGIKFYDLRAVIGERVFSCEET